MNKNLKAPILAVLGVASLAIAVPLSIANAQEPAQRAQLERNAQRQQGGGQGQGQGQPPMEMMQRMGQGGGAPVMIDDQQHLYILIGPRLFKVNKGNLDVVAEGMLPMGGGPGGGGGGFGGPPEPGQPGVRSGGRSGGGELSLPGDPIPPTE